MGVLSDLARETRARIQIEDLIPATPYRRRIPGGWIDQCPLPGHDDSSPSFAIYCENRTAQHYHCFGCSRSGTVIDYVMQTQSMDFKQSLAFLNSGDLPVFKAAQRQFVPVPTEREIAIYTRDQLTPFLQAMRDEDYQFIQNRLGVPEHVVRQELIGRIGTHVYTFPSFDADDPGLVRAIMHYDPEHNKSDRKWIHHNRDRNKVEPGYIYRANQMRGRDRVIICEGGKDALLGVACGFDCSSMTNGAMSWRPEWNRIFEDANEVVVMLDWDAPKVVGGKEVGAAGQRGTDKILRQMRHAIPVDWNVAAEMHGGDGFEAFPGYDAFDWFSSFGQDPWVTDELIEECKRRYAL